MLLDLRNSSVETNRGSESPLSGSLSHTVHIFSKGPGGARVPVGWGIPLTRTLVGSRKPWAKSRCSDMFPKEMNGRQMDHSSWEWISKGKESAWYCWRMFSAWRWPKCSLHRWILSSGGAGGSDVGTLASCAPNPQSPMWPGYASSCITEVAGNGTQTKLHISWWRHRYFLATGSAHRKHGHVYGHVRTWTTFSLH